MEHEYYQSRSQLKGYLFEITNTILSYNQHFVTIRI